LVEHPIPDTTIYLNGEPYRRDIFESPVVFKHTGDIPFSITVTSNDHGMIVEANNKINKETGKASIVEVIPKKEGNTAVNILVDDGCGGLEYSFNVSVQDTSK